MIGPLLCILTLVGQPVPGQVQIEINPAHSARWEDSEDCVRLADTHGTVPLVTQHPDVAAILCPAITSILDAQDPGTAAITRSMPHTGFLVPRPAGNGYALRSGVDALEDQMELREAGWYLLALDHAGLDAAAGKLAHFLAARIQLTENAYGPRGGVAGRVYANGAPAVPFYQRDIAATAYVLAALRLHADFLDAEARAPYLEEIGDRLYAAGDLLANWTLGGSGEIAPAYVPAFGHDGVTPAMYFEFWMGIESARQCLAMRGEAMPDNWSSRQRELMSRIKFQRLNRGAPAPLAWDLGQWFQRIAAWAPGELGLYLANEAGVPAPAGFAWDMPELLARARDQPAPADALAAAKRVVAIAEFLGAVPAAPSTTP